MNNNSKLSSKSNNSSKESQKVQSKPLLTSLPLRRSEWTIEQWTLAFTILGAGVSLLSMLIGLPLAWIVIDQYRNVDLPNRKQQAHYQAWTLINSAQGTRATAGRIEALQNLNKDGVSLAGLSAERAILTDINLSRATLLDSNFKEAILAGANFKEADLSFANFELAALQEANFENADLIYTNLQNAILNGANLKDANLDRANLRGAKIEKVKNLSAKQVKSACFWKEATFEKTLLTQLKQEPDQKVDCSHWK